VGTGDTGKCPNCHTPSFLGLRLPAENELAELAEQLKRTLLRQEIRTLILRIDAKDGDEFALDVMAEVMILHIDMSRARSQLRRSS